ncbi:hypothetical protein KY361_06335 [Candidatus Woesearchaeota archaeon]|nr:hypothetical protein [Candidatus Woesearchaeota archaeon]
MGETTPYRPHNAYDPPREGIRVVPKNIAEVTGRLPVLACYESVGDPKPFYLSIVESDVPLSNGIGRFFDRKSGAFFPYVRFTREEIEDPGTIKDELKLLYLVSTLAREMKLVDGKKGVFEGLDKDKLAKAVSDRNITIVDLVKWEEDKPVEIRDTWE